MVITSAAVTKLLQVIPAQEYINNKLINDCTDTHTTTPNGYSGSQKRFYYVTAAG